MGKLVRKTIAVVSFAALLMFIVNCMPVSTTVFARSSAASNDVSLHYSVPPGWVTDHAGAKKMSLLDAIVPAGQTVENAGAVITISFDKKDPNTPGLDTLKNYYADDMHQTLAQAPDAQFARWQPSKLDPAHINFMSIEIYGKQKNQPAPQHLVIVDAGNGFYSVAVTTRNREELQLPIFDNFFNSLTVASQP